MAEPEYWNRNPPVDPAIQAAWENESIINTFGRLFSVRVEIIGVLRTVPGLIMLRHPVHQRRVWTIGNLESWEGLGK